MNKLVKLALAGTLALTTGSLATAQQYQAGEIASDFQQPLGTEAVIIEGRVNSYNRTTNVIVVNGKRYNIVKGTPFLNEEDMVIDVRVGDTIRVWGYVSVDEKRG